MEHPIWLEHPRDDLLDADPVPDPPELPKQDENLLEIREAVNHAATGRSDTLEGSEMGSGSRLTPDEEIREAVRQVSFREDEQIDAVAPGVHTLFGYPYEDGAGGSDLSIADPPDNPVFDDIRRTLGEAAARDLGLMGVPPGWEIDPPTTPW